MVRDPLEDLEDVPELNQDGTPKDPLDGRQPKLNKATREKILKSVRQGNFLKVAATVAGVTPVTLSNYIRLGREQKSGLYREFLVALRAAQGEAESLHVGNITEQSDDDWKASAWYLERKHQERWGKKETVGVKLSGGMELRQKKIEEVLDDYAGAITEGDGEG